jgi:hypothetical protein
MRTFMSQLALTLRVIPKGGTTTTVLGGDIKLFDLQLTNYGLSGTLEFDVYDDTAVGGRETDKLLPAFLKSPLIRVELDVAGAISDTTTPRAPVTLKGIVSKRSLRELPVVNLKNNKQVTVRRYRVEVADAARVLWGQHHPCKLYADKTMDFVIKDHKSDLVTFEEKWDWASKTPYKTKLVFFALDPSIGKASFYDFLIWYVDRHRLIFSYDCTKDRYSIVEEKVDGTGAAIKVLRLDFDARKGDGGGELESSVDHDDTRFELHGPGLTIDFPEVPRYLPNVIDSFTGDSIAAVNIPNPYADAKTGCDTLLRTALLTELNDRASLEQARLTTEPNPELTAVFHRFPAQPIFPGDVVEFDDGPGQWNSDSFQVQKKSFRVFAATLSGRAVQQNAGDYHGSKTCDYHLSYATRLELKSDLKTPRLPPFVEPTYPVHVEGKILSDVGATDELTYDPKQEDTGLFDYRVEVPLWKDTAPEITAPYNPGRLPGQMFFPAYKGERVLLALTWRKAWIESFLDWRPDVRIPADSQGNHMLLGKNPTSRTSLINYYENQSSLQPIFEIARTHNNDLQTIRISEGNLRIEVKEDAVGLPVKVENVDEAKQD